MQDYSINIDTMNVCSAIPCTPSSGRRSCLLYRMMSPLLRADLAVKGARGVTLSQTSSVDIESYAREYFTKEEICGGVFLEEVFG